MKNHPFVLESPLTLEECIRRLQDSIAEEGMGFIAVPDWVSDKEIYGIIDDNQIELRKRRGFFLRNDAAPHLFATLAESPRGTLIEGYFSTASYLRWARWFAIFFLIIIGGSFFSQGFSRENLIPSFMMAIFVVGAAFGMPRVMYYLSLDHEGYLLKFVLVTLSASASPPEGETTS